MRFVLILVSALSFWLSNSSSAQFLPEVDSVLRIPAPVSFWDATKSYNDYFVHLTKDYGNVKVTDQLGKVLDAPGISLEHKLLFSEFLTNAFAHVSGDPYSALQDIEQKLERVYAEAPDKCKAIRLMEIKAGLYSYIRHYAEVQSIYDFIYRENRQNGCVLQMISYQLHLTSSLYAPLGNVVKATEANLRALRILDSLVEEGVAVPLNVQMDVYHDVARINYNAERYAQAIEYWRKNIAIDRQADRSTPRSTGLYNNIGLAYTKLKRYGEARENLDECIRLAEQTKDSVWLGIARGNVGDLLSEQGKYEEAIPFLADDIRLSYRYFQYGSAVISLGRLGYCYYKRNDFKRAEILYDSALHTFHRWKNQIAGNSFKEPYQTPRNIYRYYAELELSRSNYKEAYMHQRKAEELGDSLTFLLQRQEISLVENYYSYEKQESQNKLLQAEVRAQRLSIYVIVALSLFVGALSSIGILFYKMRLNRSRAATKVMEAARLVEVEKMLRLGEEMKAASEISILKQQQTEDQLAIKGRELSSIALHIHQKNEVMAHLKDKLENISQKESTLQEDFKSIYRTIRKDLNINADWEKFKMHFEQVHPNFFLVLNNSHPDLSLNDLRICAYVRMNIDNKSIAQILNVASDSLRVRKHRLRKRMNFNSDKELYSYLVSIR